MDVQRGDIVQSRNGRDQGRALFVADTDETYLSLVDGKSRRQEQPKRKKRKHCMFLARDSCRVAERLRAGERVTNSEIRRALAVFKAGGECQSDETGGG